MGATSRARARWTGIEFFEADATPLPPRLHGRFELVYATLACLLVETSRRWMRSVHTAAAWPAARAGGDPLLFNMLAIWACCARSPSSRARPQRERGAYDDRRGPDLARPDRLRPLTGRAVTGGDRSWLGATLSETRRRDRRLEGAWHRSRSPARLRGGDEAVGVPCWRCSQPFSCSRTTLPSGSSRSWTRSQSWLASQRPQPPSRELGAHAADQRLRGTARGRGRRR